MENIGIIGAGGHSKVVFDIVKKQGLFDVTCFFAKGVKEGQEFLGLPVYEQGRISEMGVFKGVVAIGDNWVRSKVVEAIKKDNPDFQFVTAIHPSVPVGLNSTVGEGSVVMPGAVIGPDSRIGNHCILNTSSAIDHDGQMAHFSSLAPGATLGGNVSVGEYSAISLGANLIHGISVGAHTVVGSGSTVVKDIGSNRVAYGLPCREVKERKEGDSYL